MIDTRTIGRDISGTATRTVPLCRATRPFRMERATWVQELDVDGDKTVKIRNRTKAVDLTAALDIDALAAQASAEFALTATAGDLDVAKGDQLELVYTVVTAGVVAPGACGVEMACRFGRTGEPNDLP